MSAIDCVFLTCFRSDYSFLATVLRYSGVRLLRAESVEEADFLLTAAGATAILSDVTFSEGTWRDVLQMATELHPLVPLLIVAEPVDVPFLSDCYTRGACGVLWKPLDYLLVIQTVQTLDQAARDRAGTGDLVAGRLPDERRYRRQRPPALPLR